MNIPFSPALVVREDIISLVCICGILVKSQIAEVMRIHSWVLDSILWVYFLFCAVTCCFGCCSEV